MNGLRNLRFIFGIYAVVLRVFRNLRGVCNLREFWKLRGFSRGFQIVGSFCLRGFWRILNFIFRFYAVF